MKRLNHGWWRQKTRAKRLPQVLLRFVSSCQIENESLVLWFWFEFFPDKILYVSIAWFIHLPACLMSYVHVLLLGKNSLFLYEFLYEFLVLMSFFLSDEKLRFSSGCLLWFFLGLLSYIFLSQSLDNILLLHLHFCLFIAILVLPGM